jgi:alcohol dehydrogenase-like protein
MKAFQFEQYGEPAKVLVPQERPFPEPGKGEVRVGILASPVNPSDLLFVRGHYAGVQPHFPLPVGFEGGGIVDLLGPQIYRPIPGQRVAVINARKVGAASCLLHIVRDDDNRKSLLERIYELLDFCRGDRVERRTRFIHQDDLRFRCNGAGDTQTLLLTSGKAKRALAQPIFDFVPKRRKC